MTTETIIQVSHFKLMLLKKISLIVMIVEVIIYDG